MFLKRLPGISYINHKGYLSGGLAGEFWHGGFCPEVYDQGVLIPSFANLIRINR